MAGPAWSVTASTSARRRCPTSRSPRCSARWPRPTPARADELARRHPALGPAAPAGREPRSPPRPSTGPRCSRRCTRCSTSSATRAPVALVVEDAHWADASTRDLISFLLSRRFAGRLLVLVTFRSDEMHRRHPLRQRVAEWVRASGVERVQLEPLPPSAVRAMVADLVGDGDEATRARSAGEYDDDVTRIVQRAKGNAFYVEELVSAFLGGGWSLPEDLADLLLVRLDRLDEHSRDVVRVASAAGQRVSHELLARVAPVDEDELEAGAAHCHRRPRAGAHRADGVRVPACPPRRGGLRRPAARRADAAAHGVRRGGARAPRQQRRRRPGPARAGLARPADRAVRQRRGRRPGDGERWARRGGRPLHQGAGDLPPGRAGLRRAARRGRAGHPHRRRAVRRGTARDGDGARRLPPGPAAGRGPRRDPGAAAARPRRGAALHRGRAAAERGDHRGALARRARSPPRCAPASSPCTRRR